MFFKTNPLAWENIGKNIDRQIVGFDDSLMMVLVRFKKGAIGYVHQHFHSQATYIAEGTFEVTIENQKEVLSNGDSFFVPSNNQHGVVCLEDGILVDVFSPKREDLLK
jgi:quercetin dioxygenase-like cupin family protein